MNIDKKLNLAIPLPRANGQVIHIHSQPISEQVFDQHFEIIAQTHTMLFSGGYGAQSGPRIAAKLMKKIATEENVWDGAMGVAATLMAEIKRLTNVLMPTGSEFPMLPFDMAIKRGVMSPKEADIVENAIVFFIVVSAMQREAVAGPLLEAMAGMWGAQITSLNSTEFVRSLMTSTETDSSGETQAKAS